jgi:hypothetical protein
VSALKDELFAVWKRAYEEMKDDCGSDKELLMALEIFGLRMLAQQLLNTSNPPKPKFSKFKPIVRR